MNRLSFNDGVWIVGEYGRSMRSNTKQDPVAEGRPVLALITVPRCQFVESQHVCSCSLERVDS